MNTESIRSELDQFLPDSRVIDDVRNEIVNAGEPLEIDEKLVPNDCEIQVLSKAFIDTRVDIGFGTCVRVAIALGRVLSVEFGINALYGFAVAWYSDSGELITIDFESVLT